MQNDQPGLIVLHPKQNLESELKWRTYLWQGAKQIWLFVGEMVKLKAIVLALRMLCTRIFYQLVWQESNLR